MKLSESWQSAFQKNYDYIQGSAIYLALYTENFKNDPMTLMQLGAAVTMNKPIFIVAPYGTKLSENIKRVADVVEFCEFGNPDEVKRVVEKIMANAGHWIRK